MSDDAGNHPRKTPVQEAKTNVVSHLTAARKALDDALVLLKRNAARRGAPAPFKKPR